MQGTRAVREIFQDVGVNCIVFGGEDGDKVFLGLDNGRVLIFEYPSMLLKVDASHYCCLWFQNPKH